jgi:muramoyltetrapeptide carboxypeptidase
LRVIAPSRSAATLSAETITAATNRLEAAGFSLSFGRHWQEAESNYMAASIEARLADLHEAFAAPHVDGILTAIGGYNSNQLLEQIDYDLVRKNPKVFCGYSDITVLCNAIFAKTNMATYYGPHFSSWGMEQGFEYSIRAVKDCLLSDDPYALTASKSWSDDLWFTNQEQRTFHQNVDGNVVLRPGKAQGRLIGGHLTSFANLRGTPYWPALNDAILFIEQSGPIEFRSFDALLQSMIQQHDFSGVQGILIGRFQQGSGITIELLRKMLDNKPAMRNIRNRDSSGHQYNKSLGD